MFKTAYQLSRGAWFPKKNCFRKRLIFYQIRNWSKFFSNASRKIFLSSEKRAIYMFTETFWRKNVLFFDTKLFFLFRDIDRGIFGTFRQKNFVRFVENSIQRIRRIQLMEILPLRNLELCNQLRTLKKQSLDFFLDNFATVGKNVLAHSGYN